MKKYSIPVLVSLFCLLTDVSGQTANVLKDVVAARIVHYYNAKQYDSIHMLYNAETKKLVTLPKTREFFDNFQKMVGPMKEYSFIEEKDNSTKYRAVFEKEVYWMIMIEWRAEISALYFMAYDGPEPLKKN